MNNYLLIVLSVISLSLFALNAQAQKSSSFPAEMKERTAEQREILYKVLDLTEKQESKMAKIQDKFKKGALKVMEKNTGDEAAVKLAMNKLKTKRDTKMKKVLTAVQYEKLMKIRAGRDKMKSKKGGMSQKGGMQHKGGMQDKMNKADWYKKMNLTPEQIAKVDAIQRKYRDQMKAIAHSGNVPQDQLSKRFTILNAQKDRELSTVLNKQQMMQYKAMMAQRGKHGEMGHHNGHGQKGNMGHPDKARPGNNPGRPVNSGNISAEVMQQLNLTDKQTAQFNSIIVKYKGLSRSAMKANQGNQQQTRIALMKIRADKNNEIKSILSASQYNKFMELMRSKDQQH